MSSKRLVYLLKILIIAAGSLFITLGTGTSCSNRPYYSSERVYNARKASNKRIKKRGYSNKQYRKSPRKKTKWRKKRGKRFKKSKYKTGGGFFRRLFRR